MKKHASTFQQINQKLERVLPPRHNVGGVRPGCTGPEAMGPDANGEEMWKCPAVQLTKVEKRMILAEVVAIGVRTIFKTHLYTFGGRVFHQKVGGPIGLRGTGAIARVVMAMTDRRVKS